MKKLLLTLTTILVCSTAIHANEKRKLNYYPQGREIVCVNGNNTYTRALYGTHTAWRLETSDRPLFATHKKNECRNLRFFIIHDGKALRLDSTSYCKSAYEGGRRYYLLKNDTWSGEAELELTVITASDNEGALFKFTSKGLPDDAKLMARFCNARSNKFSRNGDMGVDDLTKFNASPDEAGLQVLEWNANGTSYLNFTDNSSIATIPVNDGNALFEKYEQYRHSIVSRVEFNTPDPFFNAVGGVLMHATDGLWDDLTWQHGCVGWRTPLAGWRGAYSGDAVGWFDRSYTHFKAYANSQVTNVPPTIPHPTQDPEKALTRGEHKWGTQMYSNGYICRTPNKNNQMHHYDMNLNYIDALLWHFSYDANPQQLREFWPTIKLHLEWEKRNFDPDGDHLYDAYCCIWASDALYYNSGAVTHSSAYNYRGNRLAARIAEIIGENPEPYRKEAEAILKAMNERLWMSERGTWCEFQDLMGMKRQHPSAALWSIYTPIDCNACTPEQAYQATKYVDRDIPHIPMRIEGMDEEFYTISTTDWQPYEWSTNNVAHEEVANMALAYLQAGRTQEGFKLLKGDIIDEMYLGASPGNFGQISYYDKVLKEAYRDFGDNIGITSRALINGLFGILPDALNGRCVIKQAFPEEWNEASIKTPYLSYKFRRNGNKDIYEIENHFPQPLQIIVRANAGGGAYLEVAGSTERTQTIIVDRTKLPAPNVFPEIKPAKADVSSPTYLRQMGLEDITPNSEQKHVTVDLSGYYNSKVNDIFANEYTSPRSPYTTLEIGIHGIGQWCHPEWMAKIAPFKSQPNGMFDTKHGLKFKVGDERKNIIYTSLWNNYPNEKSIKVSRGKYSNAYLMMAGSTNNMQSRIDNGLVIAVYSDNTTDTLHLENPINWCPIEQDFNFDEYAFWSAPVKPYRFRIEDGFVSRNVREGQGFVASASISDSGNKGNTAIKGGGGVILKMPLNPNKKLNSLLLKTLSNDVVIGIMGITLEK